MTDTHMILHPTDFSENSRPAFETACSLARDADATLLVLHVMLPSVSPVVDQALDPSRPIESQPVPARFPWPEPQDARVRVQHRLSEGDPAKEILRLIETEHCDLVVMGSHGRSGLGRFLAGSVAEEVLRTAPCPVLVVKPPLRNAEEPGAVPTAHAGDVVDVRPLGPSLGRAHSLTLVRTHEVAIDRLVVPSGRDGARRRTEGETIVHCLEGRVVLEALGTTRVLEAGHLVDLPAREPYTLRGVEDSSLLVTTLFQNH
jgi:nucleotide-binding universal stress UspA family protein/quercetin dioxygenase-like cupin family protein